MAKIGLGGFQLAEDVADPAPPPKREPAPPKPKTPEVSKVQPSGLPKFKTFKAKQVLMRRDQQDELTRLARELHDKRDVKGERITENDVIRTFVDLGLKHYAHRLKGSSEAELRKSVGL